MAEAANVQYFLLLVHTALERERTSEQKRDAVLLYLLCLYVKKGNSNLLKAPAKRFVCLNVKA